MLRFAVDVEHIRHFGLHPIGDFHRFDGRLHLRIVCDAVKVRAIQFVEQLKRMRMDGVVVGVLMADGRVDVDRTAALIEAARPMSVTFHRACDVSRDWEETLDTLMSLGVDRVLTSGQARAAPDGAATIAAMVTHARGRICILPGGGITPDSVKALVDATGVEEVHLTGASARASAMVYRAPHVEIGTPPPRSEYEWAQTDAATIRTVVQRLAQP